MDKSYFEGPIAEITRQIQKAVREEAMKTQNDITDAEEAYAEGATADAEELAEEDEEIKTEMIYLIRHYFHKNISKLHKEYGSKHSHNDEASLPQKYAKQSSEITLLNRGLPTTTGCPFKVAIYSATSTKNKKEKGIIPPPSSSMKPGAD